MTALSWTDRLKELDIRVFDSPLSVEMECRNSIVGKKPISSPLLQNMTLSKFIADFGSTVIDDSENRSAFLKHLQGGEHKEDPLTFIFFCEMINQAGLFLPNWDMFLARFAQIILEDPRHSKSEWLNGHIQWIQFNSAIMVTIKYLSDITDENIREQFLSTLDHMLDVNLRIIHNYFSFCKGVDNFQPLFRTFRMLERRLQNSGPHVHHPRHIEVIVLQLKEVYDLLISESEAERQIKYFPQFVFFLADLSERSLGNLISMYSTMGLMNDDDFEKVKPHFNRQIDITSTGAEFAQLASHESLEIDFLSMKCRAPTLFGSPYQVSDLIEISVFYVLLDYIHEKVMASENSETPLFQSMLGQIRDTIGWYQTFYGIFEDHPDWSMVKMQGELKFVVDLTGSVEAAGGWWPKDQIEYQNHKNAGFDALVNYEFTRNQN